MKLPPTKPTPEQLKRAAYAVNDARFRILTTWERVTDQADMLRNGKLTRAYQCWHDAEVRQHQAEQTLEAAKIATPGDAAKLVRAQQRFAIAMKRAQVIETRGDAIAQTANQARRASYERATKIKSAAEAKADAAYEAATGRLADELHW